MLVPGEHKGRHGGLWAFLRPSPLTIHAPLPSSLPFTVIPTRSETRGHHPHGSLPLAPQAYSVWSGLSPWALNVSSIGPFSILNMLTLLHHGTQLPTATFSTHSFGVHDLTLTLLRMFSDNLGACGLAHMTSKDTQGHSGPPFLSTEDYTFTFHH